MLNEELLIKQKVTKKQVKGLLELYNAKDYLFKLEKSLIDSHTLSKENAGLIKNLLTNIEFSMQDNWNFERNKDYHKYWFRLNACSCPKLDNIENIGCEYRYINNKCIYHGYIQKEEDKLNNENLKAIY